MSWQNNTVRLEELEDLAEGVWTQISFVQWLKDNGYIPQKAIIKRGVGNHNANLDPEAISLGYLAAWGYDFDDDGLTLPSEALGVLAFDIKGNEKKDIVAELLSRLGENMNAR